MNDDEHKSKFIELISIQNMTCPITEIKPINLSETPEEINWPETHYLCVEKIGPFYETAPACWQELHSIHLPKFRQDDPSVLTNNYFSIFNVGRMIYCAGVEINSPVSPDVLKDGASYIVFEGGQYALFKYIGSYSGLPQAWGRVEELKKEKSLIIREDVFCIEHYVNDPVTTPEHELLTNLLVPIK